MLSQRKRIWWRNIPARPELEMILKGTTIRTIARLAEGDEARQAIATCLRLDPRLAKFYRIELGPNREPDQEDVRQLDSAFVVIVIDDPSTAAGT